MRGAAPHDNRDFAFCQQLLGESKHANGNVYRGNSSGETLLESSDIIFSPPMRDGLVPRVIGGV